jgi:hypothetical protein
MTALEQLIAELTAKAGLHPDTIVWMHRKYDEELAKHGDETRAVRELARLLGVPPRGHEGKPDEPRTINEPIPTAVQAPSVVGRVLLWLANFAIGAIAVELLLEANWGSGPIYSRGWAFTWYLTVFLGGCLFSYAVGEQLDKLEPDPISFIQRGVHEARNETRLWFAFSLLWIVAVIVVFLVFNPFGIHIRLWGSDRWLRFLTVLVGPVLAGLVGLRMFIWATRK